MWRGLAADEVEGSAHGAAPSPRPVKHPNCGLVSPLWQGDGCIGLSGLYACLNGIRLVLADHRDITAPESDRLFRAGLRFLDGRLSPQQCVANGLRVQLWRQLVAAMAHKSAAVLGERVIAERVFVEAPGRAAAFEALERSLRSMRVVLMLRDGGQYTVVI